MNDQPGPGTHILYQDITIPAGVAATLSAQLYVRNAGEQWYTANTLDYNTGPNQQVRVDIMSTSAPITDIASGVLRNLYRTQVSDPRFTTGYVPISSDLTAFAGQTIRLRFAAVDTRQSLMFGVDAVSILVPGTLSSSVALSATPAVSTLGNSSTLTATISTPSLIAATGGITFYADNVAITGCVNVVPINNVASCSTTALTLGTRQLRANYTGDSNFSSSVGSLSHEVVTVPTAPNNVLAQARNAALLVSFATPTNNGGTPITGYTVVCTPTGGGTATTVSTVSSPVTVEGLSNGTAYQCSVSANNLAGSSAPALAPNATPVTLTLISLQSAVGPITLSIPPSGANCGFTEASAVQPGTLAAAPLPPNYVFPYGLVRFKITGCAAGASIAVDIKFPGAVSAAAQYWKFNSTSGLWYQLPFTLVSLDTIRMMLTDGGIGDDDGVADGTISDPGGLADLFITPVVPTVNLYLLCLMAMLLALSSVLALRKKS
jgi:hypothetical protein